MHATCSAGMALDSGGGVNDFELFLMRRYAELVTRHNRDDREQGPFRFPAFGAAADMVMGALGIDADLDPIIAALTVELAAGKAFATAFNPIIDSGMNVNTGVAHGGWGSLGCRSCRGGGVGCRAGGGGTATKPTLNHIH